MYVYQSAGSGDKVKLDEANARIHTLERNREDLIEIFRKQMKLIDILKRQKVTKILYYRCTKHILLLYI